jgi:lanthionine synthetase-like protein
MGEVLYDPASHEPLRAGPWDPERALALIERIVRDTETHFTPGAWWPLHPRDLEPEDAEGVASTTLHFGAAGVVWALGHLRRAGAAQVSFEPPDSLLADNREWLRANGHADDAAAYLMGDTPIELMRGRTDRLEALIAGNRDHPSRELMWGAPGTMLAALFLWERTGDARWARMYRESAATLWSQLEYSDEHGCRYWTQDMYGKRFTFLDGVHGFVANASPLIRGRELLGDAWEPWREVIVETVSRTVTREGPQANWRHSLITDAAATIVQMCHGAPGFVICLADLPGGDLDDLLSAAGETTWAAGPLVKGAGLCHGTGGNGYAFLKLHRRTGDPVWLERARAFAMHGIGQVEDACARYGHMRFSLWTGDLGFAVYLWDCVQGGGGFPTLDVF